jgi:hypothetical protein
MYVAIAYVDIEYFEEDLVREYVDCHYSGQPLSQILHTAQKTYIGPNCQASP